MPPEQLPNYHQIINYYRPLSHQLNLDCHPKQWQEIYQHHSRVTRVTARLLQQASIYLNQPPSLETIIETTIAAGYHDLGKSMVPFNIHQETHTPRLSDYYDFLYRFHPARSLALLGKDFIKQHPPAAKLIFFHHPNQSIKREFLGISPVRPTDPEFLTGLATLIISDGITAGWEIRYGRKSPASPTLTIAILQNKLFKAKLHNIVNLKLAVPLGYQTLNQ